MACSSVQDDMGFHTGWKIRDEEVGITCHESRIFFINPHDGE